MRHENRQAIFKASERLYIELAFLDTDKAFHRGGESWNGHGKGLRENLAERLGWEVASHDDLRVAQRLYHKQVVDGIYRLDEGALLDDFFYCLQERGVPDWLVNVQGTAGQRETLPFVHYILRSSANPSIYDGQLGPFWERLWGLPLVGSIVKCASAREGAAP
jgi:hypothetical protein